MRLYCAGNREGSGVKRAQGSEVYSLSRFDTVEARGMTESWDFGRKNMLPVWPEFAVRQFFLAGNFFSHTCPSITAFELPLDGDLLIEHNDRITLVKPGSFCILPAGEDNTLRTGPSGSCRKLSVGICGQLIAPFLAALGFSGGRCRFDLTEPERAYRLVEAMFPLLRRKDPADVAELSGLAIRFLTELRMQQPHCREPLIADAIRIFEFNLGNPIALGTVAAELNLSELKLIRLFKLHLGVTPKAYLIALRMRRAESLLAGSVRPVNEIALSCGYGSARCFSREFRKKQGISPLEFRRRSLTNPVRSDLLNDDE